MRNYRTVFSILFALSAVSLNGDNRTLDSTTGRAERLENKRVEKKIWARPKSSPIQNKTFPIKEWNKHFSGLGSKRAPITVTEKREKERFETKVFERKTKSLNRSNWNEQMADLHERAGIELDDQARIASNHKLYNEMMQDSRQYRELGETLSLREINRYQFRNNRPDGEIPAIEAGARQSP